LCVCERGELSVIEKTGRLEEVDLLRGFAILGVIVIHTSAEFAWIGGLNALVVVNIVLDVFFHYAVPLFVLISGFVLSRRYGQVDSLLPFYRKRGRAILPPYLFFSLVYIFLAAFRGTCWTLGEIVFSLLTAAGYYHLWFIAIIVQFYALYPFISRYYKRLCKRKRGVAAFLIIALLCQLSWNVLKLLLLDSPLVGWVMSADKMTILVDRVFLSHLFYFAAGIHLGQVFESFQARACRVRPHGPFAVAAALTAVVSLFWIARVRRYGYFYDAPQRTLIVPVILEPFLYIPVMFLLFRLSLRMAHTSNLWNQALGDLGVLSLGIYLIHELGRFAAVYMLRRIGLTGADWLFYPLVFIATIVASYLIIKATSYLPYSEWLIGAHHRPPPLEAAQERKG